METKELHIISCTPSDLYFWWSTKVFLNNLRKYGLSDRARILLLTAQDKVGIYPHPYWRDLEKQFPEAKFFFYFDKDDVFRTHVIEFDYIPLIRPYLLKLHWQEYPELKEGAIYYTDSDTCFMREPTFLNKYKDDEVNHLSFTGERLSSYNYMNVTYLEGKVNDALPELKEAFKQVDVVQGMMDIFGLKREVAVENNLNFGGAQYLLKGITADFWQSVYSGCIYLRRYLRSINRRYFASEDKGYQSWCSDMWSILFNLWRLKMPQDCPPEMDFIWATDHISKWATKEIYHDSGAGHGSIAYINGSEHFLFFKRKMEYINQMRTPFDDDLSFVSDEYCSYNYVKEIEEAKKLIRVLNTPPPAEEEEEPITYNFP